MPDDGDFHMRKYNDLEAQVAGLQSHYEAQLAACAAECEERLKVREAGRNAERERRVRALEARVQEMEQFNRIRVQDLARHVERIQALERALAAMAGPLDVIERALSGPPATTPRTEKSP